MHDIDIAVVRATFVVADVVGTDDYYIAAAAAAAV